MVLVKVVSTNLPVLWTVICSIHFEAMDNQAHGAIYESLDHSISIRIFMVGFVDDTSGSVNDFLNNNVPSPHDLMKPHSHRLKVALIK
jgi:hypothetical protein